MIMGFLLGRKRQVRPLWPPVPHAEPLHAAGDAGRPELHQFARPALRRVHRLFAGVQETGNGGHAPSEHTPEKGHV